MDCVIEEREGVVIVAPKGDLDAEQTPDFQQQVDALLATGAHYFVIDLAGVPFVDSAGLASLVRLFKRVRIGEGDVRLAAVTPDVLKILDLTRLSRVFDVLPSADEAAASIKPAGEHG